MSDVGDDEVEALAAYGMNLGMAFQIVDDLLDFTADRSVLGKPVASDLKEGKLTLPLIYLLEQSDPNHYALVQTVFDEGDFVSVSRDEIVSLLRVGKTLERTRDLAVSYARQAQKCLDLFDPGPARNALRTLPDFVISRQY
jgi:geranylgeranyl pyrophosphate synthase